MPFQCALVEWFDREGLALPWRETRDPYAVLVSEMMLQQTRVRTVLERGYYQRWMEAFPDVHALARAGESEILALWQGLGYYNRARNLQKAAREVVERHGGAFPEDPGALRQLPGVGRYTAGAVASLARGVRAPIVDGNVIRVYARLFSFRDPVDRSASARLMWEWAEQLTPGKGVRSFNSGLMELGQRVCTRAQPACDRCPVSRWCRARAEGEAETLPVKARRVRVTDRREDVALVEKDGRVLLVPENGTRRAGLWKLPEVASPERSSPPAAALAEKGSVPPDAVRFSYHITRYRVELTVHRLPESDLPDREKSRGVWFDPCEESDLPPLGAPYRRALAEMLDHWPRANLE